MTDYTCPEGHTSSAGDYCDVCGAPIGAGGADGSAAAAKPVTASGGAAPGSEPASSLDLDAPAVPPDLPSAGPVAGSQECPNCSAPNALDALFCEDCGYDFTTGQMPRPLQPPAGTAQPDAAPVPPPVPAPAAAGSPPVTPPIGSSDPGAMVQPPPSDPAPPQLPPSAVTPTTVEWVVEIWVDPDWHAAQDVDDPCPSAGMPVVVPLRQRSVLIGRTSTSRNIHPEVDVAGDTGVSRRHAQLTSDGQRWWVEDLQSANGTYVGAAGQPLPAEPIIGRVELGEDGRIYLGAWTRLVVRKASSSEQASAGS